MNEFPAETWVNVSGGGEDWPMLFSPQHATVPLVLTPQAWSYPAEVDPDTAPSSAMAIDPYEPLVGGVAARPAVGMAATRNVARENAARNPHLR